MLFRMIKVWITSLLWGKASIGWRIVQTVFILGIIWLAYEGAMFYIDGKTRMQSGMDDLNRSLAQCVDNRVKDRAYQARLEATIKEHNKGVRDGQEKIIVKNVEVPPPPPEPTLVEQAKEVLAKTTTTISEVKSKVFTDRRVGFGYMGGFSGDGIAHGAYIRYDILSVWGKSFNVGVGATYGTYKARSPMGMPSERRPDLNFIFMGGFEL